MNQAAVIKAEIDQVSHDIRAYTKLTSGDPPLSSREMLKKLARWAKALDEDIVRDRTYQLYRDHIGGGQDIIRTVTVHGTFSEFSAEAQRDAATCAGRVFFREVKS